MLGFRRLLEVLGVARPGVDPRHRVITGVVALLLLLLGGSGPSELAAQEASRPEGEGVVVQTVALRETDAGAELEIEASDTPRWAIRYDESGGFVLRMQGSVLAREIEDLERAHGPIAEVRVRQVAEPARSSVLVAVVARERLRVSVQPSGRLLRVLISPLSEEPPSTTGEGPEADPPESSPPDPPAIAEVAEIEEGSRLRQELEFLRAERDALARGNPTYVVAGYARPCLNLRSAPGGRELDCVDPGTRLVVLGIEGAWGRVRLDDRLDAWTRFEYLEPAPALPSSPGERALQERLTGIGSELDRLREKNLELREAAAAAKENLQRAWEAQQTLSARLVEQQTGDTDTTLELEALALTVEQLTADKARLVAELESARQGSESESTEARRRLEAATAERDELARLLDESRTALALGGSTYVILPRARPCLNIRLSPGSNGRIDCLPPGTRLSLLELRGEWARVRLDGGGDGWAVHEFLAPSPTVPDELGKLTEAQEEIAALRRELDAQLTAVANQQLATDAEMASARSQMRESETALADASQRIAQLETELEVARGASTEVESRSAAELEALRGRVRAAETRATELEAALAAAREAATLRVSEATTGLEALRVRLAESEAATADAEERASSLAIELEVARASLGELESTSATELEQLRERLAAADAATVAAQHRVSELETALAADREATTARQTEAANELETLRARLTDSEATTVAAEERAAALESELEAARSTTAELESTSATEIEALRERLAEADAATAVAETRATELEVALAADREAASAWESEATTELQALRARLADSEAATLTAEERAVDLESDLAAAHAARTESEAQTSAELEALRSRLTAADATAETTQERIVALEAELESLEARLAESASATLAAEERASKLGSELESARATVAEVESRTSAQIDELTSRLAQADAATAAARERLATLEEQLEANRAASAVLRSESATELEGMRARLDAAAVAAEERASDLQAELEVARAATAEIEILRSSLDQADSEATAARGRIAELEEAQAASAREQAALRTRIAELEAAGITAGERVAALEAELETQQASATAAERRAAEIATELDRSQASAGEAASRLERLEAERSELEERLDETRRAMDLGATTYAVRASVDPCLNLRSQPGDGPPLDCIAPTTRLTLLDVSADWALARLASGVEGWLSRAFIEPAPALPTEIEELARAERELADLRSTLDAERDGARDRLAAERQATTEAESRVAELATDLEAERTRSARLETELEAARTEAARVASSQVATASTAAELERRLQASRTEVDQLTVELGEMEAALASAHRRARDLEERLQAAATAESDSEAKAARIVDLEEQLSRLQDEVETARLASRARADEATTAREELARATAQLERNASERMEIEVSSVEPAGPDLIAARALALEWASAWSEQRIDDYLGFYSARFQPETGGSRSEWVAQRRSRLSAPNFIEISLSDLESTPGEAGDVTVDFTQSYRSDTYADTVRKTLVLVEESGDWKIARELVR